MTANTFGQQMPYLNGTSYAQSRDGGFDQVRDLGDDTSMERIRDLLFGEMRRQWDARLQTLETRLQMLEDKVDALRHESRTDREEHLAALAQGIDELGLHVRRLNRG
jgi:hypothetical protein